MSSPASFGRATRGAVGPWHPLVLVPIALSAWTYFPITRVNFFADDFANLAAIRSDPLLEFLLEPFGGHNNLARNLVFVASWKLFGLHAPLYYVTVLLTHLVNTGLLFGVIRALTLSPLLACFGATVWGTSPLCVGTLGWYSVYGQVLLTTILLFVLERLARLTITGEPPSAQATGLWYVLLLVGSTCFGVGIAVAVAFPVVLFLLLPSVWRTRRLAATWLSLPAVTVLVYFGLRRLYPLIGPPLSFQESMQERMVTYGLSMLPAMFGNLLTFSITGTILGFFAPKAYPSPAAWGALAGYTLGFVMLLWQGEGTTRRAAAAMVILAASIYFLIALGRSGMYAMFSIPPAEAAKVARYHYVGALPIVVLFCLMLQYAGRLPVVRAIPGPVFLACGLGVVIFGIRAVGVAVQEYRWTPEYVQRTAETIATEARTQPPGSTVYLENQNTPATILGPAIPDFLFPGRAAVFVLLNDSDSLEGRTLRFIERDPEVAAFYAARPASRLSRLLVDPQHVVR